MTDDMPRGFQLIRAAIASVEDLAELARLRAFAHEQWGEDPLGDVLDALFERRAAEIEGRPDTQIPLPLGDDDADNSESVDRDAG